MKAKTFENLIRKIVREEIDYALRREMKSLKEDLRDELKPTIIEQTTSSTSPNTNNKLKENIMGKNPFKKQNFVGNSTLNDLLNETAQGDTNLNGNISPASMMENFSTVEGVPEAAVPTEVANAVNRDYSSLMKAIDKRNNK